MRRWLIGFTALLFVLLPTPALAQNASDKPKPDSLYAEIARAPANARPKHNPLENDPNAVAAGRNLFDQHCAGCNAHTADGGTKGPNPRRPEAQRADPCATFGMLT